MVRDHQTVAASKVEPDLVPDPDSDSEDDADFVPEDEGGASGSIAYTSKADTNSSEPNPSESQARKPAADSDEESTEDEGDYPRTRAVDGEIDADELEALKRERQELVAAAGGEDRLGKRRRLAQSSSAGSTEDKVEQSQAEAAKAKALAEWEAMKGSPNTAADTAKATHTISEVPSQALGTTAGQEEMISIPTTYKFAGETHTSTRLLPRSHPDAIKYLSDSASATTSCQPSSSTAPTVITAAATAAQPRPPPGPRRKKGTSLAAMSAAAMAKPAKLNTLEKSKLDWDQFKADAAKLSRHELDELENQTRGGGKGLGDMKGYLERRDFLDRVKDRTGRP